MFAGDGSQHLLPVEGPSRIALNWWMRFSNRRTPMARRLPDSSGSRGAGRLRLGSPFRLGR